MKTIADLLEWKGTEVITVPVGTLVLECARRMADAHIGSLIVTGTEGGLSGIVTRHDLLEALTSAPEVLDLMTAQDIMSRPVRSAASTMTLEDAQALMHAGGIHHLLIVDDGQLAGLISTLDLLESAAQQVRRLDHVLDVVRV